MKVVAKFPHEVREIENVFIPMRDGARLAARLWLPANADKFPAPAILEYIPYRKRDLSRSRDNNIHHYIAGHRYACIRVDMRGSGDSDGVLKDEYTEQEQLDAVEVIDWISRQPWCDGKVGMMGISWGGFNSLQVAARRPAALRAIVSACASDDQYADNMHFMGGCLLGDNLSEATVMFAFNSLPPDPDIVGSRWRDMWLERLEGSGLWLEPWLTHQSRSEYWRGGSVCENYSSIECPVLAVGGWADGFTNAVFRLLERLDVPRLGLIGPWGHKYPHQGIPGPAIGFLQELLRWWDYWLKDIDTGIMDEPMLRAWLQDSVPPNASYETRPGRWVTADQWPPSGQRKSCLMLSTNRLSEAPEAHGFVPNQQDVLSVQSPLFVGMAAGKWCSYQATPDLPGDQRQDDGGSLVFDTEPLQEPLEILGAPRVNLEIACDRPIGMVAVRLSDVAPDGKATRITYGLLNLTHRDSDEHPDLLQPGHFYRVQVKLNGVGQRLPTGHRLRLSISSSYWPLAWTPPELTLLKIRLGGCSVSLPLLDDQQPGHPPFFQEPAQAPSVEKALEAPSEHNWRLIQDLAQGTYTLEVINDQGRFRILDTGTEVARSTKEWYSCGKDDVNSVRGETFTRRHLKRGDWDVEVITNTILTADASYFHIHATLDAYENSERIFSKNWSRRVARRYL